MEENSYFRGILKAKLNELWNVWKRVGLRGRVEGKIDCYDGE